MLTGSLKSFERYRRVLIGAALVAAAELTWIEIKTWQGEDKAQRAWDRTWELDEKRKEYEERVEELKEQINEYKHKANECRNLFENLVKLGSLVGGSASGSG